MSVYNYPNFPLDMDEADFAGFPTVLKAGEAAPDGELTDLATGGRVRLSDYWREGPVMIEFGSYT